MHKKGAFMTAESTTSSLLSQAPAPPDRNKIVVQGAREHNLKDLNVTLPKKSLVVFTGPSGSGKSSLAFDTIYAEGRRRYVESLSTYARQFLGQMDKPDFDLITGLSPTISIEQKTTSNNPRSTIGTITEIYDHMRVLWSKLGEQRCHECGEPISALTADAIVSQLTSLPERTKLMLLAPKVRNRKGEFKDLFDKMRKHGFVRARIDGELVDLEGLEKLKKTYKHDIDIVIDRVIVKPSATERIKESVELALREGEGGMVAVVYDGSEAADERLYSTERACLACGIAFPEVTHQSFSFNSPVGCCPECRGIGSTPQISPDVLVLEPGSSIEEGAIEAIGKKPGFEAASDTNRRVKKFPHKETTDPIWEALEECAQKMDLSLGTPWEDFSTADRNYLLYGSTKGRRKRTRGWAGVIPLLEKAHKKTKTSATREFLGEFIVRQPCESCDGARLRPESRAVFFQGEGISTITSLPIDRARAFFDNIELEGDAALIGTELIKEISDRLAFLENVGLQYLDLNRSANTLSGGESQRIRLASQLGSELSGILYILDEPSIGLHQRDNERLLETLHDLRDRGNSVLVVEHDRDTMEAADYILDFGPGAGRFGGEIVARGDYDTICAAHGTVTGDYLSGRREIEVPKERRPIDGDALVIKGASANNLRGIDVSIPKGCFVCVTGVSGAGKSTLVNDILYPAIARRVYHKHRTVGAHEAIEGIELFDKIIEIDQKPIGRTPRSNPATYTKVFDNIRELFAGLPESKMYGFKKGRFSFNVAGGRCEECKGDGSIKVEMSFLSDVYVPCEVCMGKRFNAPTLRVTYRGHTIADVLDLSIAEAAELFSAHPKISRVMDTLLDVGLDYIKLGQPSPTLSGGEAQRIKLSRELAKIATGDTLYILDEPSTGLHFEDIRKLLDVINRLVDAGNTVVVIEHNMDIIKCADAVIDLGPEGGEHGGQLVAWGTPEQVAQVTESETGRFLAKELSR